jgi:hypothetical protein
VVLLLLLLFTAAAAAPPLPLLLQMEWDCLIYISVFSSLLSGAETPRVFSLCAQQQSE